MDMNFLGSSLTSVGKKAVATALNEPEILGGLIKKKCFLWQQVNMK